SARACTRPALNSRITTVRIRVARFELMPATPTLPRMAVSPAKPAEPSANSSQLSFMASPATDVAGGCHERGPGAPPGRAGMHPRSRILVRDLARGVEELQRRVAVRVHHQLGADVAGRIAQLQRGGVVGLAAEEGAARAQRMALQELLHLRLLLVRRQVLDAVEQLQVFLDRPGRLVEEGQRLAGRGAAVLRVQGQDLVLVVAVEAEMAEAADG